jgi:hypothetical protein
MEHPTEKTNSHNLLKPQMTSHLIFFIIPEIPKALVAHSCMEIGGINI